MEHFAVYVSRIPPSWSENLFFEHFVAIFGGVERVELFTSRRNAAPPQKGYCYQWKNEGKCEKWLTGDCPYSHGELENDCSKKKAGADNLGSGVV